MTNFKPDIMTLDGQILAAYQKRKRWYAQESYLKYTEFFETELNRVGTVNGDEILEIGFGDGLFLDWAKASGFNVTGIEINADFVKLAEKRGHHVYLGDVGTIFEGKNCLFDLICFFDVLEHLNLEKIAAMLETTAQLLKNNGRAIAKFPNGASPFGRVHQHGDATHKSTLSGPIIEDIASLVGLKVLSVYNSARSMKLGRHQFPISKKLAYLMRNIIQAAIGYLYFGKNIPMDPNITVILGKQ